MKGLTKYNCEYQRTNKRKQRENKLRIQHGQNLLLAPRTRCPQQLMVQTRVNVHWSLTERVCLNSSFRNNVSAGFLIQNSSYNSPKLIDVFKGKLQQLFLVTIRLFLFQIVVESALSVATEQ